MIGGTGSKGRSKFENPLGTPLVKSGGGPEQRETHSKFQKLHRKMQGRKDAPISLRAHTYLN